MPLDDGTMLALLAPEYRAYVERERAKGGRALDQLTVAEARQLMREMQTGGLPQRDVRVSPHSVDDFSVRIVRPAGVRGPLPIVVYYHGGGWVLGDFDTHARMIADLAIASASAIVFVEYARAPEAPFPQPLEQCYRALTWVAAQAATLGLDPKRISIAGDSAGGNLAAAVALLAARRGGPQIRLQALLYPVTDCDFSTASYRDFESGLNLDLPAMRWFWDYYVPDPALRTQLLASPLRAPLDDLRNLPPTLVITAECDVLRDEGEAFARKLAQAGVPVAAVRFAGVLHAFMMIDELAFSTQAVSAMELLAARLAKAAAVRPK
jgi:acetyl esterase